MVAERGSTVPSAPMDSPYTNALDDYDLNVRNMHTTGNDILDSELNHMIAQTHRVKEACQHGFQHMDMVSREFYQYASQTNGNLVAMKMNQDEELQKIRDQIYDEIKTDKLSGSTVGSKIGVLFDTIERMRTDIEAQFDMIRHNINTIRNSNLGNGYANEPRNNLSKRRPRDRPILEYKSIGNLPQLGNNKSEFRGWKDRLRNALRGIYEKEIAWKFWMDLAEKHHKNVEDIRDEGYKVDQNMDMEYDEIADILIAILQDKIIDGTDANTIVQRYVNEEEDGIKAWGELYRYYKEISG